jgi:hypothetical protein
MNAPANITIPPTGARVEYTSGLDSHPPRGSHGTIISIDPTQIDAMTEEERAGTIQGLTYIAPITIAWDCGGQGHYATGDFRELL